MTQAELIHKYQVQPVKRFGQNFLIDENIQRKMLAELPLKKGNIFIEIGPGLGALTLPMLKKGERVIALELDKKLVEILKMEMKPFVGTSLDLIPGDALEFLVADKLKDVTRGEKAVLFGNLPYAISSPLLFRFLQLFEYFDKAYFTLQKEVVDRLVAKPGSETYGRLSVSFGYFAHVKRLFDIAPGCFRPKPEVWSSFIEIELNKKRLMQEEKDAFLELVKLAFSERRKQLAGLLVRAYGMKPAQIEDFFIRDGHSPNVRAENLKALDFWRLLEHILKFKSN